jgi:hypothetical protein
MAGRSKNFFLLFCFIQVKSAYRHPKVKFKNKIKKDCKNIKKGMSKVSGPMKLLATSHLIFALTRIGEAIKKIKVLLVSKCHQSAMYAKRTRKPCG